MGSPPIGATFKLPGQAVFSAKGDFPDHSAMHYTSHQGAYFAHRITLEGLGEAALRQPPPPPGAALNRHRVDVPLFALSPPLSKGPFLPDEAGLAKPIE